MPWPFSLRKWPDVVNGNKDFARHAGETRVKMDAVVVHLQTTGRAEADVEDDFALLDVFHRHLRAVVHLGRQIGRVAVIGTPFVDRA